jgi:hypothetical protein
LPAWDQPQSTLPRLRNNNNNNNNNNNLPQGLVAPAGVDQAQGVGRASHRP